MSSGNFDLTTYYAKRIIGDAAAATAANALLQTGDDITSNIWILHRTNRTTKKYGIHYAYDETNGHDKIEFYGKGTNDDATAWVQLDTGDASFNNINSYGTITTMTLFLKNTTTDLTQSNNGSDNTIYHSIWGRDKNNNSWFCVEGYTNSSGSVAAFLGVRNYNTEGVAQSWKGFTIIEDKSNNLTYTVSDPHAFRSAISTWALVSDSYNTFMPADGTTNGWYKFGTSNTSYGILPSASGGAGSGHNYIGTSTWYWKYSYIDEMYGRNLTISGNNNGISFTGTKATQQMIKFIDANDEWGHGIVIGGGGLTILGSGEAANTLFSNLGATGATETTYISSDGNIEFLATQQNGYDASARIWMTASVLNIGVDGNTTRESSVNVYSGAGRIQLYSAASATGNRGIWAAAHGTGAAKTVITVDTNNNVTLNGNAATATRINGNLTAATSDVNRNIWVSSTASADGIPNYISGFNMNPSTKVFTVPAGTRISPSTGALYLGNSGNQSWVYVQDICGQDGQKWKIHQNGNAEFTGTVTAPTFSGNASSADSLSGGLVTNTVTSHGNLAVTTAKGSYYGINFGHNASGMSIMSINASHQGLYNQTNGQWIIYYNAASTSKSISIGSSTVNITGGISLNLNTKITGTLEMTGNQTITGAGAHWTKWQNTTTGVIISMWSDTTNQGIYSYSYWNGSANASGAGWILYRGTDSYVHTSFRLYGAVWNDYAEYRECDKLAPGTCVQEHNNGHLTQSDRRLIPGASIISDTFGFAEGQTEKADTPIAVSGRVLAYTHRNRYEYHAGQAVCSAPDGTIDIMSRDEIMMYPDAIVGIVSEIPEYKEWGTDHIKVNNRIWIKVK